jgi:hypothetical protein
MTNPNEMRVRVRPGPQAVAVGMLAGAIVLGGALILAGCLLAKRSEGASPAPVAADLAGLESGAALPNIHIELGEHYKIFPASYFWFETYSGAVGSTPSRGSKVKGTYVPLISPSNPYAVALKSLTEKYGALANIPASEVPDLKHFAVLLCTDRYSRVSDIPEHVEQGKTVKGLVNRLEGLGRKERALVTQNCPGVDPAKLIILTENAEPSGSLKVMLFLGGGVGLILAAVANVIRHRNSPRRIITPLPET